MTQFVRPRATAVLLAFAMVISAAIGGALIGRVGLADAVVGSGDKAVTVNIDLVRIRDTRTEFGGPIGGPAGKLGAGATETVQVAGTNGIPADAKAVCINLTVLDATATTFVSAFGAALPLGQIPETSTVNPGPGDTSVNGVIVPLDSSGQMRIYNNAGSVNFFIDVSCYTVDHHHDDRYSPAESQPWIRVAANGTKISGSEGVTVQRFGASSGQYLVSFGRDVSACGYLVGTNALSNDVPTANAILGDTLPGGPDLEAVFVRTETGNALDDMAFTLMLRC